jgi:RNA polymerase sigma-70 factor (ECF subfamily)
LHVPSVRRGAAGGRARPTDEERFAALYEAQFHSIYTYVWRRVVPSQVADAVQEVFAVAWRAARDIPAPPEDRLWLYGVARRVVSRSRWEVARQGRLRDRLARAVEKQGAGRGLADPAEARLEAALARLRPRDLEVVRLVIWDDLDRRDVAGLLGCSVNAVDIRFHRAMKRMRDELGPSPAGGGGLRGPASHLTAQQGALDA